MSILGSKSRIVIMDGSDSERVNSIIAIIKMWNKHSIWEPNVKVRPLSEANPGIIVLEAQVSKRRVNYNAFKRFIELVYPGLCIFDPPMRL